MSNLSAAGLLPSAMAADGIPSGPEDAAQLTEQLRLTAQVTSRLSHDFGNLLTGILGFSELAAANVAPGTLVQQYLGEVRDVAVDGAAWLKKLALFCRGRGADFAPANLYAALADVETQWESGDRPQIDLPPDLPNLVCDSDALRHVVRQLLENARDATASRGSITVSARPAELAETDTLALLGLPSAGSYVKITVADDGSGLCARVRAHLFRDPFFSTKPRHRGLGLLMTYGIVCAFGGGLRLDAGSAGGTQAHVYFQIAGTSASPAVPE